MFSEMVPGKSRVITFKADENRPKPRQHHYKVIGNTPLNSRHSRKINNTPCRTIFELPARTSCWTESFECKSVHDVLRLPLEGQPPRSGQSQRSKLDSRITCVDGAALNPLRLHRHPSSRLHIIPHGHR